LVPSGASALISAKMQRDVSPWHRISATNWRTFSRFGTNWRFSLRLKISWKWPILKLVADPYLQSRLAFLAGVQNPDGGWGYFPGKQSWMEPTVYAVLALRGTDDAAAERGWRAAQSWRGIDGSWRPGSRVQEATWVTALGVIAAACLGHLDTTGPRSVEWLLATSGQESRWTVRLASYLGMLKTDVNVNHRGWPWHPGNSAWIEPTALTILALKKSLAWRKNAAVQARIYEGEELILSRRDRDGGWNSGNPSVLKYDLPSYPETTALALVGLQGRGAAQVFAPLATAREYLKDCKSSLAKAWLTIALRCYGEPVPPPVDGPVPNDILLCALQAMAAPSGNHRLLTPGGAA
jgi:hypothetical protein